MKENKIVFRWLCKKNMINRYWNIVKNVKYNTQKIEVKMR